MPPTISAFWNKLNANEKMVMYGAIIVVIAFIIGLVGSSGFGTASTDLVAAIAIAVIYWLKYSPSKINWPVPVQTIVVVIAGISALFALIAALGALAFLFAFGLGAIALLVNAVGCGVMAWFAYKEYQAMPKATPPAPTSPTSPPSPTYAPPPTSPTPPPPPTSPPPPPPPPSPTSPPAPPPPTSPPDA